MSQYANWSSQAETTGARLQGEEQPVFFCAGGVTLWNPQSGLRLWTTAGIAIEAASGARDEKWTTSCRADALQNFFSFLVQKKAQGVQRFRVFRENTENTQRFSLCALNFLKPAMRTS